MNLENDQKLVQCFPLLYRDRYSDIRKSAMAWGFCCGNGWYGLIWRLSEKLEALIQAMPSTCAYCDHLDAEHGSGGCGLVNCDCTEFLEGRPKATQVKEKFASLRFYMTWSTPEMEEAIEEAERESREVCEGCGAPGEARQHNFWLFTMCEECVKNPRKALGREL